MMCFQLIRWMMRLMLASLTPNSFARVLLGVPAAAAVLIARTLSAVSFAFLTCSPRMTNLSAWARMWCASPVTKRPFLSASCMLSLWVPRNRWSGFTHWGVSHTWQTCFPFLGPLKCSNEKIWAPVMCPRLMPVPKAPYPPGYSDAVQSQQPQEVTMKWRQNRSNGASTVRGIAVPSEI